MSWDHYLGEDTLIVTNATKTAQKFLTQMWQVCLPVKYGMKYALWTKVVYVFADPAVMGNHEFWWTTDENVIQKWNRSGTEVLQKGVIL